MKYEGLRVTVMGLGLFGGGSTAASWLAQRGAVVTVTDTASADRLALSLETLRSVPIHRYQLGGHREQDFTDADLVIINPAIRPDDGWLEIATSAGARLTSEIELFLENCPSRMVGVTGSNGKSTTAAMIASILKADGQQVYLGGNIGKSLLDDLERIGPHDWVVLELSSFQLHRLGQTARVPETAVITNFTANHLNWHPDLAHYAAAKQRLLRLQSADDAAVLDPAAPGLENWQRFVQGSFLEPANLTDLPPLAVCGRHNRTNAALAAAAAGHAGCADGAIRGGLAGFHGLPDRLELVGSIGGRRIINDSSSTTPESTIAALDALEKPIWLLAGGADKGVDYDELARRIAQCARGAIFFGQVADCLAEKVTSHSAGIFCHAAKTLEEALAVSLDRAPAEATIVLSPGCSSHDQFVNYRQRAGVFASLVASYGEVVRDELE